MTEYRQELDAICASAEYQTRLVDAMRREMRRTPAPMTGRRRKKKLVRVARWLVPAVAVLVLALVLFSIPSVSRAVQGWLIDLFRLERYMEAGHDDADVNADIEQAITRVGSYDQSCEILLLDEIPATEHYDFESINAWRIKLGQPAFSRADWDWLLDIKPEIREVLYDGKHLIVTTFYGCDDPAAFARGYLTGADSGTPSLDILTFDYVLKVNGSEQPYYGYSSSLDFSKWYERSQEPGFSLDELKADGGVYGLTEIELPDSPALPDGICEVEMIQTVQDNTVDNMNVIGMVAEIIHRFSFDTIAGNARVSQLPLGAVALRGTAPYTVTYWGENERDDARIVTENVPLDGVAVTPLVSKRSTGLQVQMQFSYPDGNALFDQKWLRHAIQYDTKFELYIDGAYVKRLRLEGDPEAPVLEIPLTATELEKVQSIVLKPVVVYYTVLGGRPMTEGAEILLPPGSTFDHDPCETAETVLTGCDINIPLN